MHWMDALPSLCGGPEVDDVNVGVNRLKEYAQIEAVVSSLTGGDIDMDAGQPFTRPNSI
jgi:hypothetical protein